jgi:hypothetical protein
MLLLGVIVVLLASGAIEPIERLIRQRPNLPKWVGLGYSPLGGEAVE